MANRTLTEVDKETIRNKIIIGASFYKKYLVNKSFLIITDDFNKSIITFKEEDFPHLVGLKTTIRKCDFLDICASRRLRRADINTNQRHSVRQLLGKSFVIEKLQHFIHTDASVNLFLETITTATTQFNFGIRNVALNTTILFKGANNHARSTRRETAPPPHASSKMIEAIFLLDNKNKADSIIYIRNARKINDNVHDLYDICNSHVYCRILKASK